MKDYISVIIPCYNVEKYIDKCVESVLNQTYKNFEIILVDDCSTDNTFKIIKKYEKKYDNITVIKNESNKGAGYSRNNAIKYAKYDLISFIDSDDYLEDNYYEEMLRTMKKDQADVVVCDIFIKYENVDGTDIRSYACADKNDKFSYIHNGLAASPCNKIFRKKDILKYPFPEEIMNEDIATVLPILIDCKKITYTPETYYNYIQRKNSVQNSGLNERRFDLFKSMDILMNRVKQSAETELYLKSIIFNQIGLFFFYVMPREKDKKKRKKYLKKYNELSKKYDIKHNNYYWDFLATQGMKHKIFYKTLLSLNTIGLYEISNFLVSFYDWYSLKFKKTIIKEDITIDDIIDMSKYQSKLKGNEFKISVVVPNYNYEKFLLQRLYSILYQQVKIDELVILDDCSTDNSRELIDKIVNRTKKYINIRKVYNETNSGTAFKQWRKGFDEATGDYVWIAEADDYSEKSFLKSIIKPIKKDKDVVISYSDTAFIDKDGYIIMRTIKPEIDILKTGHWNQNFVKNGIDEIHDHSYLNCTIANVSSVLFKKGDYDNFFEEASKFRQAGDWLFYVYVMTSGKIAYYNKPLNYYRVHGNNVTSKTKKQQHFDEIVKVHKALDKKFRFNDEQKEHIKDRYKFLKKVWYLNENKSIKD